MSMCLRVLCCTGTMFVFGTFGTCGTFGTFGTCLALDCSEHLANIDQNQSKNCQNQSKTPKVNMLKSGDVSFDFGFEWCLGLATGYVAKMLILATYPSANSPSWPPCPGMFGTSVGTFGTFGTSGTFGTFLDPWEHCSGTTQGTPSPKGGITHFAAQQCLGDSKQIPSKSPAQNVGSGPNHQK